MLFGFVPLVVVFLLGVVYFRRHPDAVSRARFLRRSAFGLMAAVTVFFAVFAIAETIDDPGGLAAAGWISAWLFPLLALVLVGWYRPSAALGLFVTLTAAVLGLTAWALVQSQSWRLFEDQHGPVRTIVIFVLSAGLGVYGLHRPREAGWLLVTLGAVPLVLSSLGAHGARASLFGAVTPALIAGAAYLLAAHLDGGATRVPPSRNMHRLGAG